MNPIVKIVLSLLISFFVLACSKKSEQMNGDATPAAVSSATESTTPELPTFSAYRESLNAAKAKGDNEAANLLGNIEMAENGNKDAQAWLGANFRDGSIFKRDNAEAFKLFTSAANQDQQSAEYFLGVMYEHGESVPVDLEKAKSSYTKCTTGNNREFANRCKESLGFLASKMTKK